MYYIITTDYIKSKFEQFGTKVFGDSDDKSYNEGKLDDTYKRKYTDGRCNPYLMQEGDRKRGMYGFKTESQHINMGSGMDNKEFDEKY